LAEKKKNSREEKASESRSRLSSKEKKTLITKGLLACFVAVTLEIQNKHRIIRPGGSMLDLGCALGIFLQVGFCPFFSPSLLLE